MWSRDENIVIEFVETIELANLILDGLGRVWGLQGFAFDRGTPIFLTPLELL
ncbi:hypothetical protein JCM19239_2670 [Vibrio variabilis]|uniref:Uncharacterized protein n=1 Tax=Vibrio variabilis TaxID=990271 RepID=A0ABQ0JNJ8_9VIBR|nr:hypothetical protein JCM19239_2670 [Vibrio variabilis]